MQSSTLLGNFPADLNYDIYFNASLERTHASSKGAGSCFTSHLELFFLFFTL